VKNASRPTTSNGEDVYSALCACVAKGVSNQLASSGGFILEKRTRSKDRKVFNFELYDKGGSDVCGCLSARRAHDWLVYV